MKFYNSLLIILLSLLLFQCGETNDTLFSIDASKLKPQYNITESLSLAILNPNDKKIDSIVYYINDKKIGKVDGIQPKTLALSDYKLGYQNLKALIFTEGDYHETTHRVEIISNIEPKLLTYTILNTYPHDSKAYTQGLEFYRDTLYEGTGKNGISSLRKTDYKTGKVYKQVDLEQQYFGEGITILNNKVYQLTWQNLTGFVYNADTFKKEKTFKYDKKIEGWGLTNDGTNLYQSDGTEKIWKLNPETLKEIDYINVYTNSSKIKSVNELEWIDGKIYANIYQMDAIAIINPSNGAVEAVVNLSDLKSKITQTPDTDVLNGIAYNPRTKTIFVTGKNWDKMFEIKIN